MPTYDFIHADCCNMCGASSEHQTFYGKRLDRRQGLWPRRLTGVTSAIFKCRQCGLIYANPLPIPANLEQHYDVAPEEYWADSYFHVEEDHLGDRIDTFKQLSQRSPHECSALDVGAGIGKAMVALQRAGFQVSGLEPSPSFRRAALDRAGIPELQLQLASVETADFPASAFDFINFAAVLEHLPDPAAALQKALGWLKPNGLVYVEVPSSAFLLSRLLRLFYRMTGSGNFVVNTSPMHIPYHFYEFGLESFVAHGKRTGYGVAHHVYYPCAGYVPAFLIPPLNLAMKWTDTGMQLAVWLHHT